MGSISDKTRWEKSSWQLGRERFERGDLLIELLTLLLISAIKKRVHIFDIFVFGHSGGPLPLCAFAWKPWHLSKISGGMR